MCLIIAWIKAKGGRTWQHPLNSHVPDILGATCLCASSFPIHLNTMLGARAMAFTAKADLTPVVFAPFVSVFLHPCNVFPFLTHEGSVLADSVHMSVCWGVPAPLIRHAESAWQTVIACAFANLMNHVSRRGSGQRLQVPESFRSPVLAR